jgi:hypothetical protein
MLDSLPEMDDINRKLEVMRQHCNRLSARVQALEDEKLASRVRNLENGDSGSKSVSESIFGKTRN